jgi:probable phosphoglycerate mutase
MRSAAAPPSRILVLRHGQTGWNREQRMQGQLDVPLDAVGREQATQAARALRDVGVTHVVSSDLLRASATATRVADGLRLPVRLDGRLREQHFGSWQGLTLEEIAVRWPGASQPVGGEPLPDVAERARAAVAEHLVPAGTLLVVTHGDTARALLGRLQGLPPEQWDQLPRLGNAAWVQLDRRRDAWRMARAQAAYR